MFVGSRRLRNDEQVQQGAKTSCSVADGDQQEMPVAEHQIGPSPRLAQRFPKLGQQLSQSQNKPDADSSQARS